MVTSPKKLNFNANLLRCLAMDADISDNDPVEILRHLEDQNCKGKKKYIDRKKKNATKLY